MSLSKYCKTNPQLWADAPRPPPLFCSRMTAQDAKITKKFQEMRNNEQLVDVVIKVGEKRFPAHKMVLCASSDVFFSMFSESSWSEASSKEVTLYEEEDNAPLFADFLDYIYFSKITLNLENVISMHALAQKYQVTRLVKETVSLMICNIELPSHVNSVIPFHQCAWLYGHGDLTERCFSFMLANLSLVVQSPYWTSLDKNNLKLLLASDEVLVESEYQVFLAVQEWLVNQEDLEKDEAALKDTVQELLPLIRFHFMPPDDLLLLEREKLVERFADLFLLPILEAYRFQTIGKRNRESRERGIRKSDECHCDEEAGSQKNGEEAAGRDSLSGAKGPLIAPCKNLVPRIYCKVKDIVDIHKENWDLRFNTRESWSAADVGRCQWFCSVDRNSCVAIQANKQRYSHSLNPVLTFNSTDHRPVTGKFKILIMHRYVYWKQNVQKVVHSFIVNSQGSFCVRYSIEPPQGINFTRHFQVGLLVLPMA